MSAGEVSSMRYASLVIAGLVVAALAGTATGPVRADEPGAETAARSTLAQWIETEKVIARERSEWAEAKDLLEQRIALLEGELADVEARQAEAEQGLAEVDRRGHDVRREEASLREAARGLEEALERLEPRIRSLVDRLPVPLRQKIAPLAARLPRDGAGSSLTLSQRYQNVIGVINEVDKFEQAVTVTNELRELADGSTAEVRTLYVGLGQAYYVTLDGASAGVGRPGPDGWSWSAEPAIATDVAGAIAIYENEDAPAWVTLPVRIEP
ncbi:MAG: DUF3450 family protein [Acidobacteria bacterium]|nr:MAG: DUF3450 family protein [Acidobacteriota bacterium]